LAGARDETHQLQLERFREQLWQRSAGQQRGRTHKLSLFKPTDILMWETDEYFPFYFNDAGNQPAEGISQRHSGGGGQPWMSAGTWAVALGGHVRRHGGVHALRPIP
jgi:hypothetical protein